MRENLAAPSLPSNTAGGAAPVATSHGPPLTERILARLPASRWRLLWAAAPAVQALLLAAQLELSGRNPYGAALFLMAVPNGLVFGFAVLHALWAVGRLTREANVLAETASAPEQRLLFRRLGAVRGPALLTAGLTLTFGTDTWLRGGAFVALFNLPFDLLLYLPLATLIWTCFAVLADLGSVGRGRLTSEAYGGDRSLGLRPVGRLAFRAFQMVIVTLTPILLITIGYPLGLLVGLVVIVGVTAALFASLWRLHRAMVAAKRREIDRAHRLYAAAYAPLGAEPSLEVLQRQSPLLGAAEALERRARSIETWPFGDALFARIIVIASGVVTSVVVKLVLVSVGLG